MKFLINITFYVCLLVLSITMVGTAYAGEPRLISKHGDWVAYMFLENGKKVCYMASQPQKSEGNYSSRGEIFALITHRPSENAEDVFSYITGYDYKPGSDVTITIDKKTFNLFTQDDTAWAVDADSDHALAEAIQKGSTMVVKGTSKRGTLTTDTFSLSGSSKAYDVISKECGV